MGPPGYRYADRPVPGADRSVYTRTRRNVGHLFDREGEESGDDGGDEKDEEGDPDGGGPGEGHRQPPTPTLTTTLPDSAPLRRRRRPQSPHPPTPSLSRSRQDSKLKPIITKKDFQKKRRFHWLSSRISRKRGWGLMWIGVDEGNGRRVVGRSGGFMRKGSFR
ncbi:hypothetical protein GW17_00051698 [Ensete ventricosum]|nr:hypothetical protein GW17_00051698 [Ensete ventricosum]